MNFPPVARIRMANCSILLAVFSLCICFRRPISQLLNLTIVRPFISGFEPTYLSTFFLLILLVASITWLWTAASRYFVFALASFALALYLTQRWNPFWKFQNFLFIPKLYVWDVVIMTFMLPLGKFFFSKNDTDQTNPEKGFIEESPITKAQGDSFKRATVAKRIAHLIQATSNQSSFAIGIVGSYGSGKTSFMHLITEELPESGIEVMYFYPWNAEKTENISKDFFDQLADRLYYLDPTISSLVTTYARRISRMSSQGEKIIRQLNLIGLKKNASYSEYQTINKLLSLSKKKIVIVIDDVDRLYPNEVLAVLKLIRNTANFSNTTYLIAYEEGYVQEAISSLNTEAADSYLDKIIQVQIPLPKREEDDLLQLLQSSLEPILTKEDFETLQQHVIPEAFKTQFDFSLHTVFRNGRDVIRFVNSFHIGYPMMYKETTFEKLFMLELLKFRFMDVYELLYERREEWLILKAKRSQHEEYYELIEFMDGNTNRLLIEKEFKHYSPVDVKTITAILRNLFNDFNRHKNAKHSIIYPQFFERYFRFRIAKNEISEAAFKTSWDAGIKGLKQFIDESIQANLSKAALQRLFQVKPTNRKEFEQQISGIFYFGPKYVSEFGRTHFDDFALINILWDIDNEITNRFYQGDEHAYCFFLKKVFTATDGPFIFENEIIFQMKRTNHIEPFINADLVSFQVDYFRRHVAQMGLTDDAMWLLFGTRETYKINEHDNKQYEKWRFEPTIVPIVKQLIVEHDPFQFLIYAIHQDHRNKKMVGLEQVILELFTEPKDFKLFVANHDKLESSVKADFLLFFDKCIVAGPNKLVEHIFTTPLPRYSQTSTYIN